MSNNFLFSYPEAMKLWKNITLFGAVPVILVIRFIAVSREEEIHAKFPNGPPEPKYAAYKQISKVS